MARSGLYKSDVRRARESLFAEGRYPSVDAVRVALGNTGSKTTIHKYLKELEEEEGSGPRKVAISDALQDLLERLAARLQEEALGDVAFAEQELSQARQEFGQATSQWESDRHALQEKVVRAEALQQEEFATHAATKTALQAELLSRRMAEQQIVNLEERIREQEAHRQSLEDKHTHAHAALEHYRQAVKEQRDQETRRHEHQVQQLQAELRQHQIAAVAKLHEVTALSQDGVKLVAELSHTKQLLFEQQAYNRKLEKKVDEVHSLQRHAGDIERQLINKVEEAGLLAGQLDQAYSELRSAQARLQDLEIQLAAANATGQAHAQIAGELRTFLDEKASRRDSGA